MAMTAPRVAEPRFESLLDALREAILTGRYAPGTRLIQDDLAEEFGISRIPLREALRRLEGEGLVVITPNRGAIVRPLGPKDVVDLFDLRLALESLAMRRAAERYADLRESTKRRAAEARRAIASRSLTALFRLDRDFHADVAAASGNEHLVAALGAHWSQIMRVMHAYFQAGNYPKDVWADHEAIVDAVAHGDGELAVARLTTHLTESRDAILAHLRISGAAANAAGAAARVRD
jgi:DNA-binding GntR family transcriptional regulator